ncbi:MAG: hypothetical protein IT548_06120 [Alphaproteobacteria bacterium]|nr:hypothetical protein [Alphaproteobacteria bacterium]
MAVDPVARAEETREVEPRAWGRVILEEILFQAALAVSERGGSADDVTVQLSFRLTADAQRRLLAIETPGAVEGHIVTHLPMGS